MSMLSFYNLTTLIIYIFEYYLLKKILCMFFFLLKCMKLLLFL